MLSAHRPLVILGPSPPGRIKRLRAVAAHAGVRAQFVETPRLGDASSAPDAALAVLIPMQDAMAVTTLMSWRTHAALADVPFIGMGPRPDAFAFAELLAVGGDDLVSTQNLSSLIPRLRHLVGQRRSVPPPRAGRVILASSAEAWAIGVERILRRSGYEVVRVADEGQLAEAQAVPDLRFVLVSEYVGAIPATAALAGQRAAGLDAPWVIAVDPAAIAQTRSELAAADLVAGHGDEIAGRVAVADASLPADTILFLANELCFQRGQSERQSPRLLHGTPVRFRLDGADADDVGYSYNISEGGLYVRTLAPPARGSTVWVELRPPGVQEWVRLEGQVRWQRLFGVSPTGAPPGFGLELSGGLGQSMERYITRCQALAMEQEAAHAAAPTPANDSLPASALDASDVDEDPPMIELSKLIEESA